MYILIDEIVVPQKYQTQFIKKLPFFRKLYKNITGVMSVTYAHTTLRALKNKTSINPKNSFLLFISFINQSSFQAYHDHSTHAKNIHAKIAKYVGGKQLPITISLHGETNINSRSNLKK